MVILSQFYQIVEKKTSNVSLFWKVIHVLTLIVSSLCAITTAFTFGRLLDEFGYRCILHAKITFDNTTFLNTSGTQISKPLHIIDLTNSFWGSNNDCQFALFTPLVVSLSAAIWCAFFIIMSKGGSGHKTDLLTSSWGIIYPFIFFTIILIITYIISSERLKHGIEEFCIQFKPELNNTECISEINVYATQFEQYNQNFYLNTSLCILSSGIGVWSWIVHLIFCLVRIFFVADFDIQLVTIMSKEEEIQKIVELDSKDIDEISEV